jgi:hypothetical protein
MITYVRDDVGSSAGHYVLNPGNICPSWLAIGIYQLPAGAIDGILQECGSKVSRIFSIGDDAFYLRHKDSNLAHLTKRSFKPYGETGQRQNSQQPNLSNRLKDTASAALITDS